MAKFSKVFSSLLAAWACLYPSGLAHATTIVVARTNSEIVIGADSKVTDPLGEGLASQACKIRQAGNLFVAFEGLLRDNKSGFNVPDITIRALQLKPEAKAAERIGMATGILASRLFEELTYLRKNAAGEFHRRIEGQTFLRIVFAGFENSRPLVFVRSFRTAQSGRQSGVAIIPDDCAVECPDGVVTRFLGETEAIDGLPEETTNFWQAGLVAGVRKLLEIEIEARSEYVGPPLDILQITAANVRWVQKKRECAEIAPQRRRSPPRRRG